MKKPQTVAALTDLGRVQLSRTFFMRDFLYSDIASIHGLSNIPDDPDLAIAAGTRLCEGLLEPLQDAFGRIAIRSAYRSAEVNALGNAKNYNCASNERNYSYHIWDRRDASGAMGATACIVVPGFANRFDQPGDWKRLAWWVHDHLPYATMEFFPVRFAFNLGWHEKPVRAIMSHIPNDRGYLTKPGMPNHDGDHSAEWAGILP
ncbi:hypothetical protein M9980_08950 [Sphingomonas donggukensis]|uniref:Peptidase M15 n=1 Tax=Sphingomonas donggukensis TaxID=2949093 RepID=A0ABY4TU65_9SPHN|nr:hypothetical protein [Sphingomonas donggukensis]URW74704.1 hypothetical protein M9980_08950 [Sphingomonas donggukensis]